MPHVAYMSVPHITFDLDTDFMVDTRITTKDQHVNFIEHSDL
jgi:hypothetical protein